LSSFAAVKGCKGVLVTFSFLPIKWRKVDHLILFPQIKQMMEAATRQIEERKKQLSFISPPTPQVAAGIIRLLCSIQL